MNVLSLNQIPALLSGIFCLTLLTTITFSQSATKPKPAPEPEQLSKLREIYEAEISKAKQASLKQLIESLTEVEQLHLKAGNHEEAVATREEKNTITATLQSLTQQASNPNNAEVPVKDRKEFAIPVSFANLQGRLKRPKSNAYIEGWINANCIATWTGGQIIPGKYDVFIDFDTFYDGGGGELIFQELNQEFSFTIPPKTARNTLKVGTFNLGTALGFSIEADSTNANGILRLHGIGFKPVADE